MRKLVPPFLIFLLLVVFYWQTRQSEKLPEHLKIDRLLVLKSKHEIQAFAQGKLVKTYSIAIGRGPKGAKQFEGDQKTPEGKYFINAKNPQSGYHKNLGVSYPNANDIKLAKKIGKSPGGAIKIHGMRNGFGFIGSLHRTFDWTLGCVAVTNEEIDELYEHTPIGTSIEFLP